MCTASMRPTNSGASVERSDQGFSTIFCGLLLPPSVPAARGADRILGGAPRARAEPPPPPEARLADRHVLVVEVADLADRGHAVERDHADLARRELERGAVALLREQLRLRAGAPAELGAAPDLELDVVHER